MKIIHVPQPCTIEDKINDGEYMIKTITELSAYQVVNSGFMEQSLVSNQLEHGHT